MELHGKKLYMFISLLFTRMLVHGIVHGGLSKSIKVSVNP